MPSHAVPRGPEGRAQRRAAFKRRLREAIPLMAVGMTAFQVAGPVNPQGSIARQVLGVLGHGMVMAAALVVLVLVNVAAGSWARRAGASQAGPRPRWQYLAFSAIWLVLAAALVLAGIHYGDGVTLPSRACFAAAEWSALTGLVMLGRGVLGGRIRAMFWWHRPTWLQDPPRSEAP